MYDYVFWSGVNLIARSLGSQPRWWISHAKKTAPNFLIITPQLNFRSWRYLLFTYHARTQPVESATEQIGQMMTLIIDRILFGVWVTEAEVDRQRDRYHNKMALGIVRRANWATPTGLHEHCSVRGFGNLFRIEKLFHKKFDCLNGNGNRMHRESQYRCCGGDPLIPDIVNCHVYPRLNHMMGVSSWCHWVLILGLLV